MAIINYSDKTALNINSGIADINKCKADDMNELKKAFNNQVGAGWYNLNVTGTVTLNYVSFDSTVNTGILSTNVDLRPFLGVGMKLKFTQNSTTKYAIVTAITATQITIYTGSNYTLNNSGISNAFYSMLKAPYGFPLDRSYWDITKQYTANIQIQNPTSGTYYKLPDVDITVPIGLWEIGWQGNTYPQRTQTGTNEQQSGLSTTTDSFTNPELNVANFSNTLQNMQGMSKSHEYNITTKTTFNFVVRTTQTNITSLALYSGTTYGYSKLFAKCLYI